MLNRLAKLSIRGYQRFISPHKGFCCAHAQLYQGHSCSQAVLQIVDTQGLWSGRQAIKQQFQACQQAYNVLQSRTKKRKNKTNQKAKKQSSKREEACDCGSDVLDSIECCSSKSCWFD